MKKAYLAISYSNRKEFKNEIATIETILKKFQIELLVFVQTYNFKENQEYEMMRTAFNEIDSSDLLIAELTTKSVGVGIEIGYAYSCNKPIFYLRKKDSFFESTAYGCATKYIEYNNLKDLAYKTEKAIKSIINSE